MGHGFGLAAELLLGAGVLYIRGFSAAPGLFKGAADLQVPTTDPMPVYDADPWVVYEFSENALEVRKLSAGGRVRQVRGKLRQSARKSDVTVRRSGLGARLQTACDPLCNVLVLSKARRIESAEDLRERRSLNRAGRRGTVWRALKQRLDEPAGEIDKWTDDHAI